MRSHTLTAFSVALAALACGGSGGAGPDTPPPTTQQPAAGDTVPGAPLNLVDWIRGHASPMTRVQHDSTVAIYFDAFMKRGADTEWIRPAVSKYFAYLTSTYGKFGPDRLFVFAHDGQFLGGTISVYFDEFAGFRNAIDVGHRGWGENDPVLHDELTHELCHIVEGASGGVHESPAFTVWGDSKWAEFCQYDIYVRLGLTGHAERVHAKFTATSDNFPRAGTFWFRDWFFPIWRDYGGARTMVRFFALLKEHFPKVPENGGRNLIYARRMTLGEFVHFMSGAAGVNLKPRATTAFGWTTTTEAQWQSAREVFPGVVYPP